MGIVDFVKDAGRKIGLGDGARYAEIFAANRPMLEDPDRIYPGRVLRVPGT